MKQEIWKKIKHYNVDVSNLGRVRNATTKDLRVTFVNNCGYHQVSLGYRRDPETGEHIVRDGKKIQYNAMVSRLVAEAFIPNPNNFEEVNHKSEDKNDNSVENLEWVDRRTNMNYGTRNKRHGEYYEHMSESHRAKLSEAAKNRGAHDNNGKKVKVQVTAPDGIVTVYNSVKEASRALELNPSRIHYNCKSGGDINGYTFLKVE